jgi:DNA-binding transcriptional LysR family regulator
MDFKSLQTFVTICDCGTVSKAATQLRITQPALSRRIKVLQGELGLTLFDNLGRRLLLTSEGKEFLRHSRVLLAQAEAVLATGRALGGGEPGSCELEELRTRLLRCSRPL